MNKTSSFWVIFWTKGSVNPEPGIRNPLTQTDRIVQFMDNSAVYKGLQSLLFDV